MTKYNQDNMSTNLTDSKLSNPTPNSNTEKSAQQLPNHVNLEKWEDAGYAWSGTITPRMLSRLVETVRSHS